MMDHSTEQMEVLLSLEPSQAEEIHKLGWDGYYMRKEILQTARQILQEPNTTLPLSFLQFFFHRIWLENIPT